MEENLEHLTSTLIEIYQSNLEFLKENFNDIYVRVETLSQLINEENYSVKYSLEYKDGYFDIFNLEDNSWFYGINSYEDADIRSKHSNFSKDGSLDLLRKGSDGISLIKGKSFKDISPIVDYINDTVNLNNIEFQKIYKFVFMGTGLGIHMHEIAKKLNPFTTLIIEPELEIFRLSLFIIDYREFDKNNKKLFLSIEDDKLTRMNTLREFYNYHKYMNYNIKHHLLIENYQYLRDEIIDFFSSNSAVSFPYSLTIKNIFRTISYIKNSDRFLDLDLIKKKMILKNKKVLIIAAGPSLDNYIDWIEEHQNKFLIVCVDVILRKLEKHNIVPDIVVSIDPSPLCAEYLTTENEYYLNNSTIVFLSQQDESVLKVVKDKKYYFAQSILLIKELGYLGSVSNVGTYSLMIAVHFGANEIYTIGTDAAFHQKTGSRYTHDSSYTQKEELEIKELDNDTVSSYDILEVAGNLQKTVKTNRSLLAFKDSFESTMHDLKKYYDLKVYNLSDGVKIEGFEPIPYEKINKNVNEFKLKEDNIQKMMNSISKIVEMPNYAEDIKILNRVINRVKKHKNKNIKNRDNFLSEKLDIMIWILEQSKSMSSDIFGTIFLMYSELADIYVNFVLNLRQKELHNKIHLKKINSTWSDGVLNVVYDIKEAIQ